MKTKLKTYVAAMVMLFMPLALTAQTDGFFSSDNGGGSRGSAYPYSTDVTMEDFGYPSSNEGPIGSGLLIMVAAGAGYLLLKKKEEK
ncbi:MAG: hypothetical protein PUC31_07110 [Bacteroidales bacterium]|nr:hypothetical protein [Bacteroidales bacterium]